MTLTAQQIEQRRKGFTTLYHGHARRGRFTPEYRTWALMIRRCENSNDVRWPRYGGRGIRVCNRWRFSFPNFLADIGERPSDRHSIDRIDLDGHYEPGNVRWATIYQQARNRRNNRTATIAGVTRTIAEWSELSGTGYTTIVRRLNAGWEAGRAVYAPPIMNGRW